ncbi:hypothetical protein FSS13T_10230 [Flavobacterium saliperosum S13]|uniref:Por secretion system C-terminal sorting domain-containing protein n=2 Tax=Flavobacterium saliperosum TaxID=329186 RepID=A0A1G4VXB2_9FLAO|nr:T9SS type A sorting domain-containing protein [Flavobacterium saliperosum]ESU26853.1 hypothetical protein FSS13T_10230 [Flavobacterium saliperosum S13]SCX13413.1 Por secretion system C-terminal sorting domain-containing protein [Flavobacterium saliperosum]
MRKIYILLLVLTSSLSFAQTLIYEGFDFPAGSNVGGTATTNDGVINNNWATHSTSNASPIEVISGNLSYAGIAPSTGNKILLPGSNATTPRDINRGFTTTTTTLYYSALINIIDNTQLSTATTLTGTNSYFMSFGNSSGASVNQLAGRLAAVSTNSGANYQLLIQNNSSGSTPPYTANPVDLTYGTTYLVVVKVEKAVDNSTTATLWVNPSSLGGAEPAGGIVNNAGTSTSFNGFASITLRNASATPKVEIDEIKVGTTYADVTSLVLGVKENNIAGLKVYPNPVVDGKLFISSDLNSERNITIYDVTGKQVFNTTTSSELVNVSSLNAGVYVVKIIEEGKTATRKLVIK